MSTVPALGLREWARGIYATEAAVELLIRFAGGRFASEGEPWIVAPREERRGNMRSVHWLDVDELTQETTGALSGGEQRVLALAANLAGGAAIDLDDVVSGLGRETLDLVLAAIAHAGGSHEQLAGTLHPWPGGEDVDQ